MGKVLIFGHKNPDTDAITSAISYAYLQQQLGVDAEAVALGEAGEETLYALNYFNTEAPRVIETIAPEASQVMLVDHNEFQQSVSDIEEAHILAVVDHHRISNFHTSDPLYYRAEPVGCTNTIILKMFKENQVDIPKDIAGLMLSAIISDSLLLKSPTCTEEDVKAANELAEIAEVDLNSYGLDMLKAGTKTENKSAVELLEGDAKTFPMGDKTVRIGQVNVVDIQDVLSRKDELVEEMETLCLEHNYDLYLLLITNILDSDSEALVVGNPVKAVELAFGQEVVDNQLPLAGVVSRKKQVVPQLTEELEK